MSSQVFGRRTAAHALGLLFLGGSVVGLATPVLPHEASVDARRRTPEGTTVRMRRRLGAEQPVASGPA